MARRSERTVDNIWEKLYALTIKVIGANAKAKGSYPSDYLTRGEAVATSFCVIHVPV